VTGVGSSADNVGRPDSRRLARVASPRNAYACLMRRGWRLLLVLIVAEVLSSVCYMFAARTPAVPINAGIANIVQEFPVTVTRASTPYGVVTLRVPRNAGGAQDCIATTYWAGGSTTCGGPGPAWIGADAAIVFGSAPADVATVVVVYWIRDLVLRTVASPQASVTTVRFFVGVAPAHAGIPVKFLEESSRGALVQTFPFN
jgi:hypothetical protein